MGDFAGARREHDRAIKMVDNPMDELYVKYLRALELAAVQDKLGNAADAQSARICLKYHRSSEPEWFLATHNFQANSN